MIESGINNRFCPPDRGMTTPFAKMLDEMSTGARRRSVSCSGCGTAPIKHRCGIMLADLVVGVIVGAVVFGVVKLIGKLRATRPAASA